MSIDIQAFGTMIERIMNNIAATFGYSYFIMKLAKPGNGSRVVETFGRARGAAVLLTTDTVGPKIPMTMSHRVEVASTSKTITAVAALNLLADNGLSVDSKVHPYLPHDWNVGSIAKELTFRHLLEHTSALPEEDGSGVHKSDVHNDPQDPLTQASKFIDEESLTTVLPGSLYGSMKKTLELGPARNVPDPKGPLYRNINYALFRILIPYIIDAEKMNVALDNSRAAALQFANFLPESEIDPDDAPTGFKLLLGSKYVTYVRDHILNAAGISNADVNPNPVFSAMHYDKDNPSLPGTTGHPVPLLNCGGTGWKLSAQQLCMFVARLTSDGYPHNIWHQMTPPSPFHDPKHKNVIGLSFPIHKGLNGTYLGKSGSYKDAYNLTGSRAGWMVFPSKGEEVSVVAALVTNFNRVERYDAYEILNQAHDLVIFGDAFPIKPFF